jgi:hypothetical protein
MEAGVKMRVIEKLINSVRSTATYNSELQIAPACILWPDKECQWESVIAKLQLEMPELLIRGDYEPEKRTGPAIWLKCVLAGIYPDVYDPANRIPVIYLPGISRIHLRDVESCPEDLKPMVELQYRGTMWTQANYKDWTVLAFLKSNQGGLGLDVAQDNETKNAMQLALYQFMDEEYELLIGKRLNKDYFHTLLVGGDPVKDLLQWLDRGDAFQQNCSSQEWKAFIEICKSSFAFNPEKEGRLAGAKKLAMHEGAWDAVWDRYCEAPRKYPGIPEQIRKCTPPKEDLFWAASDGSFDGWPQWNEEQEASLRQELNLLSSMPQHEAYQKIIELEAKHGRRRNLVWAELSEAPLAEALLHLSHLAKVTSNALTAGSIHDLAVVYRNIGWEADDAVLKALTSVASSEDIEAVISAIQTLYLPWLENSARYLQQVVDTQGYPGGTINTAKPIEYENGECILFVDGMRMDIANHITDRLKAKNLSIQESMVWTALPSVTGTGKPAVSPVRNQIYGSDANVDFEPSIAENGQSLKGGYYFKKLMAESGWTILETSEVGDVNHNAWCEYSDIDREGHDKGWKLTRRIDDMIGEIAERVESLLKAGWKRIHIVTDHGWLLLPGGLPKIEVPAVLTENKWGRCAALKSGAETQERLFPWYWNPAQFFVLADGISCFRNGLEYAHGGLSLQECLTLNLTVSKGQAMDSTRLEITDAVWRGLRLTVAIDGQFAGVSLDIRTEAGNPLSTVVLSVKPFNDNGTASVVVEDEDLIGTHASIVLVNDRNEILAQMETVIGGR